MRTRRHHCKRGLTLIELILVMMVLALVMGVSAPWLSGFFAGQALRQEARRMVALTRYARSEAISRSTPMEVWVDREDRLAGVRAQAGYAIAEDPSDRPDRATLPKGIEYETDATWSDERPLIIARYTPDGGLDEISATTIRLSDPNGSIELARSDSGPAYEVQAKP